MWVVGVGGAVKGNRIEFVTVGAGVTDGEMYTVSVGAVGGSEKIVVYSTCDKEAANRVAANVLMAVDDGTKNLYTFSDKGTPPNPILGEQTFYFVDGDGRMFETCDD